ncbi:MULTISPECIES: hypothetical protein [Pseudoalteromonas]|uniref:Transposase n=1 Tax=Pseudoalteromonas obscura TaxID=3048491 RepID=A0ABT7EGP2_9GAMM|nr:MULTISPECIES: hypothetical protein [Pseudoalteromonas]MBQ4835533.1 hypothetical protein [Pseudoalteromonas luteoviolacea]MDK2594217.1 hypothetical protein [Pseudoalteromonas sp. P94(2023)]
MIVTIFKSLFFKALKNEASRKIAKSVVDGCVDKGVDYLKNRGQANTSEGASFDTHGLITGLNNLTKRNLPDGDYPLRLEKQTLLVTMRNQGIVHIQYLNSSMTQ